MECSFPDCQNAARNKGLCVGHRRQQLRDEKLAPLKHRQKPRSPICEFPGCGRKHAVAGLCAPHDKQRRRGDALYPVGDRAVGNQKKRERWAKLSPEEKAAALKPMHDAVPRERSEEWIRRMSAQLRAKWASDDPPLPGSAKVCPYCGDSFRPNSGRQVFCKEQCKKDHRAATVYKISIADLRALREKQDGVCGVCRSDKPLHVDHDHASGRVRGLLCTTCNTGLGKLGDSVETLRRAIAYLER